MLNFLPFQSFPSAEAAQPLLAILRQCGIPFETGTDTGQAVFDPAFAFNNAYATFIVKLHGADFERVQRLEEEANRGLVTTLAPNHYLFTFTDDELFEMLVKPDEWNSYDVALAGQILRQRGREVTPDTVRLLQQHRLAEMAKPEASQKSWILAGYFFAALGGFVGIFIGWHLRNHAKTLPNGKQVLAFSPADRAHGLRILILGCVGALVSIVLRVVSSS